jgi:hypothetical protein
MRVSGRTAGSSLVTKLAVLNNVSIANAFRNIAAWFDAVGIGARSFNGAVHAGGTPATNAVTFSSIANGDTVTLNGVVLTAETSGATGNNQFNIGGSDAQAAINLAALINSPTAPAKILGVVYATVANPGTGKVVTINSTEPGAIGNLYTLAISAHGSVTGATFASGADGTITLLAKGI